jgi:recombination protein RecT
MNAPTQVAAARPQPSHFKPLQELTVGELLEDPRVMKAMAEAAPQHLSPQRMLRVMAQAMRKTPQLALCHPLSLLGAMISCASLGLEPNTPLQHVHLIPFAKRAKNPQGRWETVGYEINLIIGYQGLIDLSRRTGSLVSIHADVVYEGDEFSFEYGSNMHLRHVPQGAREGRKPVYGYAHSKLEDGEAFEVLPYAEVMKIRDNAQAYKEAMRQKAEGDKRWATTPWIAYEHEMSAKTMVRRLAKWLPKSIEFATAVQMDSLAERGMIDFRAIAAQPALAHDPEGASRDEDVVEGKATETTTAKPTPPKATAPAAKTVSPPPPTEEDEREADRMSRTAQGDPVEQEETEQQTQSDGWDDYVAKMLAEYNAAKGKGRDEVNATFRDAVVGAHERKEIAEPRANELLTAWQAKTGTTTKPQPPSGKK